MDLLKDTIELCKLYGINPARSKGQNFLIKEDVYDKIIAAAELKPDEIVLEVGPGLGFLTAKLAQNVKKVIAVELDDKLAVYLKTALVAQGVNNVRLVNEDILDVSLCHSRESGNPEKGQNHKNLNFWIPDQVGDDTKGYKIVANLPYNISSVFLRKFLTAETKPSLMVLMLQKEVAERITAKPGKMSLLSVSVQFYAKPEIIEIVPKTAFWPAPEVDSAIVKINVDLSNDLLIPVDKETDFFRMVKFGFSSRRKMLKNNLAAGYHIEVKKAENWLKNAELDPKVRAQELGIPEWIKLFDVIGGNML